MSSLAKPDDPATADQLASAPWPGLLDAPLWRGMTPWSVPGKQASATHSSFTSAALMTAPHRTVSSRMKRAVASGSPPTGWAESSLNRLRTPGERIASEISLLILLTISRGVFGGAATANHA